MKILGLLNKEKVLYYPGCLMKESLQEEFKNYKEIFNRLGINFILLSDVEICCGLPALNAGYKKDARKLAKRNYDIFKKNKITKIITNCPSCYYMFKQIYPTMIHDWNIEVEHATISILKALNKKKIKYNGSEKDREIIAYNDSCHLGRYCKIYEEPREVLKLLGGKVVEFKLNRENAICCGAGGGVKRNFPELAKAIANKKVKSIPKNANRIISASGLCHTNIKSVTNKSVEFSTFVLEKLKEI